MFSGFVFVPLIYSSKMRLSFKHMSRNNKLNKSDIAIIWKDIAIMWKDIIWIIRLVLRHLLRIRKS